MSQNAPLNIKGNQNKTASNTKQTSKQNKSNDKNAETTQVAKNTQVQKDPNRVAESLKPTQEQMRLASLLAVRTEDPHLNDKIKQVLEICPTMSQDDVLMVLHDNDYDIDRVMDFLFEGGDVAQDWKTAGTRTTKTKPTTETEPEVVETQKPQQSETEKPQQRNKENRRQNRPRQSNDNQNYRKPRSMDRKNNKQTFENQESTENSNLEENLNNLDLNNQENSEEHSPRHNRGGNSMRGNYSRGRGRGGFRGANRGAARGGYREGNRSTGRNERREPRRPQNEFVNSNLKNTLDQIEDVNNVHIPSSDSNENSNLRDIGTWSNEQVGRGKKKLNGQSNQMEEWDKEEEWQGDLTKTQIFTASTQKKEFNEVVTQQDEFPIGHFNAEEATQKIKKAVGIGGPSTTAPISVQTVTQVEIAEAQKVKQNLVKIPPSAKPLPPPTTKIPKSAVIMPDGSTSNSINFNLDLQFGIDLDDQLVKSNKLVAPVQTQQQVSPVQQHQHQQKSLNQNFKQVENAPVNPVSVQKPIQPVQQQQQQQQQPQQTVNKQHYVSQLQNQNIQHQQNQPAQPQRQQFQNKETSSTQLLNISPQNKPQPSTLQQQQHTQPQHHQQHQQQVLAQLQQIQTNQQTIQSNVPAQKVTPNANPTSTTPGASIPPPPGVGIVNPNNLVNPNNPYLIGLPFSQNFPYFDQSQLDANNLIQMYNHLANIPPPGVGAPGAGSAPQYPISDSKFQRNDVTGTNAPLNSANVAAQLNQQQQPINLIPNLNNYPFFFHNYPYPNLFMQIPNGTQAAPGAPNQPPPPFTNKPPYTQNFQNSQEDYTNFSTQPGSQMKNSNSNLSNVNEMMKNDKTQTTGYHAPTPPNNFPNQLLGQQGQHPSMNGNQAGPQQMAYITSMMGAHNGNMVHPGMQDNLNRNVANSGTNNLKQISKANYPGSSWSQ